jgi:hypothetical protein
MQSAEFGPTPVIAELTQIARHGVKTHAVVIDDASCFENAAPGYPSLEETRALCGRLFPGHRLTMLYGMIFLIPKSVDFTLLGHKV